MELLLDDAYARLSLEGALRLVRFARTAAPYPSMEAYDAEVTALVAALANVDRARHGLLVDLRLGPMRNDFGSEVVALRFRREVMAGFARVAVLVTTHVGKLQISRHAKEDGHGPRTVLDEAEALAYLAGTSP